jgi:Ion channel
VVFEVILLPRHVIRRVRFARVFFRLTWKAWSTIAHHLPPGPRRDLFLAHYGPLSMVLLIVLWASGLIIGFATIQTSFPGPVHDHWLSALYFSGTNFFTLSYGDIVRQSSVAKGFAVAEAGIGFGFLAVVIGYLPVLYQLLSDREKQVIELDARAGSPRGPGRGTSSVRR